MQDSQLDLAIADTVHAAYARDRCLRNKTRPEGQHSGNKEWAMSS
jgi:hypothetical protein